jgi:protein arginine kinase
MEIALLDDRSMNFRFNDGEHLKFACLLPGLDVFRAYERLDEADGALSQRLNFAFNGQKGFLTADPSDMGTGLRVSLLLFLPALVAIGKIEQVAHAVQLLGCAFGGLLGAVSSSESCIFQVHNRMTLGESEETILRRMAGVGEALAEQELAARKELEASFPDRVPDRMARVIALLYSARIMPLSEALVLLGQARLAACLGYLDKEFFQKIDELFTAVLPIHLQMRHGEWVAENVQEQLRTELLRQSFGRVQLLR